MENKISVGDRFFLENEEGKKEDHFVAEFDKNGGAILKTFKEIRDESSCKGCRFALNEKGWLNRENTGFGKKMLQVVGCGMGQFTMSHNPTIMPKDCKIKNLNYNADSQRQRVKEFLQEVLHINPLKASKVLIPSFKRGVDIYDVKELTCRFSGGTGFLSKEE